MNASIGQRWQRRSGQWRRRAVLSSTAVVLLAGLGLGLGLGTGGSSTPTGTTGTRLGRPDVVLNYADSGNPGLLWVAQDEGFFKAQGLQLRLEDLNSSAASNVAVLVGNGAQFTATGTSALLAARAQGAAIRGITSLDIGSPTVLVINNQIAAEHHVPANATTAADVKRQLDALKGSHLTIGVTTTSSDAYAIFVTLARSEGLTIGPDGDITIQPLGDVSALAAGVAAGKIAGFVNTPPNTYVADVVTVPLFQVPPITALPWQYLATTQSMITDHPDTVQAVVNGVVAAWQFAEQHPAAAQRDIAAHYAAIGITSVSEQDRLYSAISRDWKTPVADAADFGTELEVLAGAGNPVPVTYKDFVDSSFANRAMLAFPISGVPA